MTSRRGLFGAAAAIGLAAGAAGWLWRNRDSDVGESARADLWAKSFATPGGEPLTMRSLAGKPLLLNFWATWCAPCVTEIPLLDRFAAKRGIAWNVLALAIDDADAVRRFVAAGTASHLHVALASGDGLDLARSLGGRGALPYSVLFDAAGGVVNSHLGAIDEAILAQWLGNVA